MSLSTHYLEYGRHVARLRRRRRRCRRRAYAPTSNTASHDNREKINSWVFFCFLYEYGAPLGGPLGRRSSAIIWRMAAILRDSVVAVAAVVRTRPRAIPLTMITMRKSIHGFRSVFYMGMELRLAALLFYNTPLQS